MMKTKPGKKDTGEVNAGNSIVSAASSKSTKDNSSKRKEIVEYALKFEGNPYLYGGTSLTNGTDCSGFTQSVYKNCGIKIPRTSKEQAKGGKSVPLDSIKPGDLIFYTKNGQINHVALYIGNKKIIHASNPKTGITISKYNYRRLSAIWIRQYHKNR